MLPYDYFGRPVFESMLLYDYVGRPVFEVNVMKCLFFFFSFLYSRYFVQDVVHENSVHYTLLPMMVNMLQSCELFFRSTQATNDLKTCSCLKAKFTRLVHNVKPTAPTYKVFMTMIPQYYLTTSTMHDKLCTKFKLLKT